MRSFVWSRIIGSFRKGGREDLAEEATAACLRSEGGVGLDHGASGAQGFPGRDPHAGSGGHALGGTDQGGWKEK